MNKYGCLRHEPSDCAGFQPAYVPKLGYLALLGLALCSACSADSQAPVRNPAASAGAPAAATMPDAGVIEAKPICPPDNPFCQKPPLVTPMMTGMPGSQPTATECGTLPIDLTPAGVNIMIGIDGSASMASHWSDMTTAIRSLRQNNPNAAFGAHLFWADPVDPLTDQSTSNNSNNGCKEVHNKWLELGAHDADELVGFFGDEPPGGTIFDVYQVAPVIDPLNSYLETVTALSDPTRTNYLVVFTSGNDNCFGSAFINSAEKFGAYEKLAIELNKRNIRLIPVGLDDPAAERPQQGMMGPFLGTTGGGSLPTDYEVLGRMLEYGGSGLTEVPRIDTPEKLAELVSVVGQTVNNCRFELPPSLDANASLNPFEVTFGINGTPVPRDRQRVNGWDFVSDSTTSVEFFGQGCQAVQAGQMLQASKSCSQDICGTAAVSVETKPRVVLLLLDSSASRIECVDGSFDCLSLPGSSEDRPPSYWEIVMHSVESALMSPVNADVSFGIQFFPGKEAMALECAVGLEPEFPPAPTAQISILRAMLEKLPLGLSPVVGVMESVAATPGDLANPGVVGAVVLLSDGGDNCSGAEQPEIVSRLGAAAKTLSDVGVRTYAIRYGSAEGETPEQAEQLNAIVNNGGTAQTGASTAYIDAKTEEELTAALAAISDKLATCSFTLGEVAPDVDKDRTSVFLNGEQIGFDAMAMKLNGWNWVDAERTTVELYGEACETFKTSRRTRVAVEFGCEPEIVQGPD